MLISQFTSSLTATDVNLRVTLGHQT